MGNSEKFKALTLSGFGWRRLTSFSENEDLE